MIRFSLKILVTLSASLFFLGKVQSMPCEDYACDSLMVRLILDSNNLFEEPIENHISTNPESQRIDTLKLEYLGLTTIPEQIGGLTELRYLSILHNQLKELPPQIGQLTQLGGFAASDNLLTELPDEFGNLVSLKRTWLYDNQFREFPKAILEISGLESMMMWGNQIDSLPPEIGSLTQLISFSFNGNNIETIPSEIGQLKKLRTIYIENNRLMELPKEMGQLLDLTSLYLRDNLLSSLPNELSNLSSLTLLDLQGNRLSEIPDVIFELKQLKYLSLNKNMISEILDEIGRLDSLVSLDLTNNQLTHLSPVLSNLPNLSSLSVADNQIETLPENLSQSTILERINLARNDFTVFPVELLSLPSLSNLNFSGNKLSELPNDMGSMQALTRIDLSNNRLAMLPEQISEMINLRSINLNFNELTQLPLQITELGDPYIFIEIWSNKLCNLPDSMVSWLNHNSTDSLWQSSQRTSESEYCDGSTIKTVSVNSPNGGEVFTLSDTVSVNWSTTGDIDSVQILLLEMIRDGFVVVDTISAGTVNSGSFQWEVSDTFSSNLKLSIRARPLNSKVFDESDNFFEIKTGPSSRKINSAGNVLIENHEDGLVIKLNGNNAKKAQVYNVKGRYINELYAENNVLIWRGINQTGAQSPIGVYLVRVILGDNQVMLFKYLKAHE